MASSSMATTSSALSRRPSSYDVFINFRGEDTRHNFVRLLCDALKRDGIHAFIDSQELWEGDEIRPSLLRAIRGSKILIPVFSEHYADSKYCLLELAQIWESHLSEGQTILPIFIGVEPRDVGHQKGSFQEPMKEHQTNCGPAIIEGWKNALRKVGKIKGWTLKGDATTTEQLNIVELVVQRAVRELHSSNPLDEEKHLIGIDSHVNELLHLLHYGSDDVRFVGICGMGGLGKTTIAKAIYNRIFRSFNGSSFLTDVREEASQGNKGLVSLQQQLLYDIFQSDYHIGIVSQGSKLIAERLHREKVLLILDDVNDYKQLDALVGGFNWFGQGSKVIITTRDVHILNVHKKKVGQDIQIYMPEELDPCNSLLLFSLHAFSKNEPPEHHKQFSNEVVNYTRGLPLSLEVLGIFLIDKDEKEWKDTLEILKDIGNDNDVVGRSIKAYDDNVFQKLKISYNQLGYREKTIFLDVACYFNGWEKEKAILLWEACELHPSLALKELIQKHLLKIDHYGYLKMHDQLQAMGRRIILEDSYGDPAKRSRLWSQDEIWKVLKEDTGTQMVEGMLIQDFEGFEAEFVSEDDEFVYKDNEFEAKDVLSCDAFQKMPNLRFLEFDRIGSLNGKFAHLPSKLRWFRWKGIEILPHDFCHRELVHLELSSCLSLQHSWNAPNQNEKKRFPKLKVLNLSYYVECSLPSNIFLWFPCLQILNLYECEDLLKLQDSIYRLASLQTINVNNYLSLRKLLDLSELKGLRKLSIQNCKTIEEIQGLEGIESLEELDASFCYKLKELPDLSKLKGLRKLDIQYCKNLEEIHGLSESLEELDASFCSKLKELPDLSKLKRLRKLELKCCINLEEIHGLQGTESLEELDVSSCSKLKELQDLSKLKRLRKLKLKCCQNLEEIPDLTESLEELDVSSCYKLKELSDLSKLKGLRKLDIQYCKNLEEIHSHEGIESLEEFDVSGCYRLKRLPDLSKLKGLRKLKIENCMNLEEIHGLEGIESLEELYVSGCYRLERLADLSKLKGLRKLNIRGGMNLEEIHGLEGTESLEEEMDASSYSKLKELPDLSKLKRLRKLKLICCQNLEEISGLTESLEELDVSGCYKLKRLPDLSKLKGLRKLNIGDCMNLEEIHGVEGIESLEELDASLCFNLKELPNFSKLKGLRKLNIRGCMNLEEIHGLEGTESLEELNASSCSELKEWPALSKLKRLTKPYISLKRLYMRNCFKITETTRKILGQGTLVDHDVGQMQGITGSPILCVVFAFTPVGLTQLQAGELGSISIEIDALIRRGETLTSCLHSIRIEDIKFTSQDIIYIHYFKGFDWFGFPLESKDAINEVYVRIRKISDPHYILSARICDVKFVKILFENKESNRDIPDQQSSAKLVAEFFRWSDADDAEEVEQEGGLRASDYCGIFSDHDEDDEVKDQQRLDQPSHGQEKGKTSSSGGTEVEEEETSIFEEIGEEEERNNTTAEMWEEEEKMTPSKRFYCHYNDDEEMPIQQPNIDDEIQGTPSDIEEAERRNRKINLLSSSSFGAVGGSNNVPEEVVEEEDETKAGMQFLCRPVKAVWDCFCNCFTPGFLP